MNESPGTSRSGALRSHRHEVRVYWEDTDAGGIVYHGSHVRFFERGRTEFLRARGFQQSSLSSGEAGKELLFAVRRMEIDYLKPAYLDDLLEVVTSLDRIGGSRLILQQHLLRGKEEIASAKVLVVALKDSGRPARFPPFLKTALLEAR